MLLDNEQSVYREKVIEHLLVSQLLVCDWNSGIAALDVLKPEIDRFGYDIVLKRRDVARYVQIKSSAQTSPVARQKVHRHLLEMVNGVIVWVVVDERLTMVSFRAIIPAVGTSIGLRSFKVAKHTKANAKGEKAERPHIRTIPKAAFQKVESLEALLTTTSVSTVQRVLEEAPPTLADLARIPAATAESRGFPMMPSIVIWSSSSRYQPKAACCKRPFGSHAWRWWSPRTMHERIRTGP